MAEHSTQHMPAPNHASFLLTDRQINRSIDEIWNNARRSVCVLAAQFCSSSPSIWMEKNTNLNGWNWNSVNWNLLFFSTIRYRCWLTGFQQNSGSYFAYGFIVKIIVCFHFAFFVQSDTLCVLVPTITTFVRLFVCLLVRTYVSNLHQNQYLKCGCLLAQINIH